MVVETPIIPVAGRGGRAETIDGTLRLWWRPAIGSERAARMAPIRRRPWTPDRRYPANPVLSARFGADAIPWQRGRALLAALAFVAASAAVALAAYALERERGIEERPDATVSELLPLDPPQLDFEFAGVVATPAPDRASPVAAPQGSRRPGAMAAALLCDRDPTAAPRRRPAADTAPGPIGENPY